MSEGQQNTEIRVQDLNEIPRGNDNTIYLNAGHSQLLRDFPAIVNSGTIYLLEEKGYPPKKHLLINVDSLLQNADFKANQTVQLNKDIAPVELTKFGPKSSIQQLLIYRIQQELSQRSVDTDLDTVKYFARHSTSSEKLKEKADIVLIDLENNYNEAKATKKLLDGLDQLNPDKDQELRSNLRKQLATILVRDDEGKVTPLEDRKKEIQAKIDEILLK